MPAALRGLDDYHIAHLTGGPDRVVLTALVALHERSFIRVDNPVAARAVRGITGKTAAEIIKQAKEVSQDQTICRATQIYPGLAHTAHPRHPIEVLIADQLLSRGSVDAAALRQAPAITAVSDHLLSMGVRRPDSATYQRVRAGLFAAIATLQNCRGSNIRAENLTLGASP